MVNAGLRRGLFRRDLAELVFGLLLAADQVLEGGELWLEERLDCLAARDGGLGASLPRGPDGGVDQLGCEFGIAVLVGDA